MNNYPGDAAKIAVKPQNAQAPYRAMANAQVSVQSGVIQSTRPQPPQGLAQISQLPGARGQMSIDHQQALLQNQRHGRQKKAGASPLQVPSGGPLYPSQSNGSQAQENRSYSARPGNVPSTSQNFMFNRKENVPNSSIHGLSKNGGSGSQTKRRDSLSLRAKSDTYTQQFLQSLGKIDGPKGAKAVKELSKIAPDPAKVSEQYNIKQRASGITDLIKILRTNRETRHARREAKKREKMRQPGQVMIGDGDSSISEDFMAPDWEGSESNRFPYPLCLSSIIMRLQDILANPKVIESIKPEYRTDIIRLVKLCLEEQRCLMYKMPFFVLNYLTSPIYSHQHSRLDFLNMITKKGRVVDKAFNTKMFLVLISMTGRERLNETGNNLDEILDFLRTLFNLNPECFSPTQTLILLTRISLLGIASMLERPELCEQVLQIMQFLMKYNKSNTNNQKNVALMALTVMVTNQRLSDIAWSTIGDLICLDPDGVVCELLEILILGTRNNLQKSEIGGINQLSDAYRGSMPSDVPDQQIIRELNVKCFNQMSSSTPSRQEGNKRPKIRDIEEIEAELQTNHKSCLFNNFEEIDLNLSVEELTCKLECPQFFVNNQQALQVIQFDASQYGLFKELRLPSLKQRILHDRIEFVETIERNLDKVKRGAVTILGYAKLGHDHVECSYSVSRILEVFSEVLLRTKNIKLISAIIESIQSLLHIKRFQLTFEWDQILDIIEILSAHQAPLLIAQKKLTDIESLFKSALDLILLGKYPREEVRVLRLYIKVRTKWITSSRTFNQVENQILQYKDQISKQRLRQQHGCPQPNLSLVGLYIDHVLQEEFNSMEALVDHLFINESNLEIKMLVLEKMLQFYKQVDGSPDQMHRIEICLIKTFKIVFKTNESLEDAGLRGFRGSDQNDLNLSNQHQGLQLEAIDILAFMAHKCKDHGRFKSIINILTHTASSTQDGLASIRQQHPSFVLDASAHHEINHANQAVFAELTMNHKQTLMRLIQVFKLKVITTESYKSAEILKVLLEAFEKGLFNEREIILKEIIDNIRLSKLGDFCWVTNDYPLMIGFKEYARINSYDLGESDPDQLEFIGLSQKMVISLQSLMIQLLEQLKLEDEQTLAHKLKSLQVFKNLLISIMASEDYLYQVRFHHDVDQQALVNKLDLSAITANLISYIDIERNLECSKAIFDILPIILGAQDYSSDKCHKSQLLLSSEIHTEIFNQIIRSVAHSFNFYVLAKDKSQDILALRTKLQNAQAGGDRIVASQIQDQKAYLNHEELMMTVPNKSDLNFSMQQPTGPQSYQNSLNPRQQSFKEIARTGMDSDSIYPRADSFNVRTQADPIDYLLACQQTLGLLGYALEANCRAVVFCPDQNDSTSAEDSRQSFFNEQKPKQLSHLGLINFLFEYLFEIVRSDLVLPHVSFQVISVLQGVARLLKLQRIPNSFFLELSQILLFRLALPQMVQINESFQNLKTKQIKGPNGFLEYLMKASRQSDSQMFNAQPFKDSPQTQILLDRITSLQIEFFQLKSEFVVFQALQNFLDRLRDQLDNWISSYNFQKQDQSSGTIYHQLFLSNLVDILQWTRNCEKGGLKKHLALQNEDKVRSDRSEFFILNQSLIQIYRLDPNDSRKVQIVIRNSAYNFAMEYQIQNPQQALDEYSPAKNRLKMMVLRGGEQPSKSQTAQVPEINQEILLQAIHPIVVNEMHDSRHRGRSLFALKEVNRILNHNIQDHTQKAIQLCDQLDNLIPFNLNIVFVASRYTDKETALDFVSRLGNCEELSKYAHYFKGLPEKAQTYINGLTGVVYDKDEREFFVIISDILQEDTKYEILATIPIQIVYLGSLTPIAKRDDLKQNDEEMKKFLKFRKGLSVRPALKVFQLNTRSYVVSSSLQACNHDSDPNPWMDPLHSILQDPSQLSKNMSADADSGKNKNESQQPERSKTQYLKGGTFIGQQALDGSDNPQAIISTPTYLQYDFILIQNESLGSTMRRLLQERKSWSALYQGAFYFKSPSSFERQRLLHNFISEAKRHLPKLSNN